MHARTTQHQTIKSPTVCVKPSVTRDKQCSVRWTYETQRNHDSQNQFTKFTPNQQSISRQHITKTSAEVGVTFPPARPNKTTQHCISRTPVPSKRKNVHIHKNGTRTSAVRIKMFPFAAVKTHRVSASHHRKFISTHVLDVEALHYLTISLEG